MNPIWLLVTLALLVLALTAMLNTLTYPRLRPARLALAPRLSVLVPARDEAPVIAATLRSLLSQDYPDFEVLLLDDHSSDGTGRLALQAAGGDRRFRLVKGADLPPGWLGKNWACHQLSQQADGSILVFADADVHWAPGALTALVHQLQSRQAGMLAVWPTQVTRTPAERLVVPLLMLVALAYLPEIVVRGTHWRGFAAANGQCLAFTRPAYDRLGGHAAVRNRIVEDVSLARLARSRRVRLVMALGEDMVSCRMYSGWAAVRDGFAKNIVAGFGGVGFVIVSAVFHILLFWGPWVWLLVGPRLPQDAGWPWIPLALVILGLGVRALTAAASRQRIIDALWMPVSVGLMLFIAARGIWWSVNGGPRWKGRRLVQTHSR